MAENKAQENEKEFSFINEKIKRKPLNRKRIGIIFLFTVFLAIVFGTVAAFVFSFTQPYTQELLNGEETVKISQDENEIEKKRKQAKKEAAAAKAAEQEAKLLQKENNIKLSDYEKLQSKLYNIGKEANKSVVTVQGLTDRKDWFDTSFEKMVQASGIIVARTDTELLILTEKKVITDVKKIRVTFVDSTSASAKLKKYDGNTGIAILSVKLASVTKKTKKVIETATFGDSLSCTQGQPVIAVGSPSGSPYSILKGNITSVNNTISTLDATYSVFTTDMVSGKNGSGALVNLNGEIVGLVMQKYSNQKEESTLTAISISNLKWLIEQLSNDCDIPYLGLKISTVTKEIAKKFDMPEGVYIKNVEEASPAMIAGLQNGDVIIKMDTVYVKTIQDYEKELQKYQPDETLKLTVKRQDGKEYSCIKCVATVGILK